MFKKPTKYFPLSKSSTVSKLNVENVVNPPKKPVVSAIRKVGEITLPRKATSKIIPMINEPMILTASVPYGKDFPSHAFSPLEIK